MDFLNAWAIGIGALAIAAPVAVHLLTKPKPVAFPMSTVRFLQEVIQQRRARSRLRDWLILLLRTLCVALLALALARPVLQSQPAVPLNASTDAQRVLIVDCSQSMASGSGGVTAWSSAVASALQYLESSSGMKAAVVFAGAQANPVFDQLSPNITALREAIKQAKPLAQRCDPRSSLEAAANILSKAGSGAGSGTKELVIISDFQRANWGTLLLDLIPQDTQIQFHSVAQPTTDNIAITSVRFSSEPIVGQATVLEVEVANYSDREATIRCGVDLSQGKRTLEATLLPQSTKILTQSVTFNEVGWQYGWAELESNLDVLPDDDQRPVAVRIRPPVTLSLITKKNSQDIPSSSFYLQQALSVSLSGLTVDAPEANSSDDVVARVHPLRDPLRSWPVCDVYVLDHPGALSEESLKFLAAQIRRGKGLLYVTAELVDAVNLQQLADILGGDFQPPVELVPDRDQVARQDLFVRQIRSRQAPFSILGSSNAVTMLKPVRFYGGLGTRATSEGLKDQVLAELSDTSALLYISGVGAGQIAVLNTDLSKSNWAVQPTFLPVVSELAGALLTQRGQSDQASSGEPLVRILPSSVDDKASLIAKTVEGPSPKDDNFGKWQWVSSQSSMVWNWPDPPGAGIYSLSQDAQPVWVVATSAPAIESDLSTLDKDILTERISGQRAVGYAAADSAEQNSDDIWKWLIVGCLCGLIGEIAALRWSRM